MTFDELLRKLLEICPNGELGEDLDGQLVFYTGFTTDED
jgi:tartrate dehydratase beta subunit/fumarate hydratase class I family protein